MTTPSQGLRALSSLLETIVPELSGSTQAALGGVIEQLHDAADAEAAAEAARLGGAVAGPVLSAFATAMVDGFFMALRVGAPAQPAAGRG